MSKYRARLRLTTEFVFLHSHPGSLDSHSIRLWHGQGGMRMQLFIRSDYGSIISGVRRIEVMPGSQVPIH
jgi:hypothetical protein